MITNDRQGRGPQRFQGNGRPSAPAARPVQQPHTKLTEENYVALAESSIKQLKENSIGRNGRPDVVTTSQIRNLLAMTADIYNDVVNTFEENMSGEIIGRINYLKVRFIYESGRDKKVKALVTTTDILRHLDDIGNSKRQYILFSRYMEALVAFRKYLVEQDG